MSFARSMSAVLAVLLLAMGVGPARAEEDADQIRARFLLLIGEYVTWPADAFSSPAAPVVIAVVGDTGLASDLRALSRDHRIEGHPVEIRDVADPLASGGAHIVFVPSSADARAVGSSGQLRISENPAHARATDIAIRLQTGRVAFAVNQKEVQKRGLKLSSKLMRLASSFE